MGVSYRLKMTESYAYFCYGLQVKNARVHLCATYVRACMVVRGIPLSTAKTNFLHGVHALPEGERVTLFALQEVIRVLQRRAKQ